jgi:hypothetical protein
VEPEKVFVKILHQLRERVQDQDQPSVAVPPLPQVNVSSMLIVEQEITEQSGDYSANDNSFDPVRIHCSFDTNPEQSVHDAFQAGVPFAEDWKLSNHQVQVYGVKTSANQCTSEQEMKSSDLSKFVKDCGLDLVADFLSQSPTLDHEPDSSQHLQETTVDYEFEARD